MRDAKLEGDNKIEEPIEIKTDESLDDKDVDPIESSEEPVNMPEDDSEQSTKNGGKRGKGVKQWFKRNAKKQKRTVDEPKRGNTDERPIEIEPDESLDDKDVDPIESSEESVNMPEDDSEQSTKNGKRGKGVKQWFKRKGKDQKEADQVSKLRTKLEELLKKLKEEEDLSPLKRAFLLNKIERIQDKLEIREKRISLNEVYENGKTQRNDENNNKLKVLEKRVKEAEEKITKERIALNVMMEEEQRTEELCGELNDIKLNKEVQKANGGRAVYEFNLSDPAVNQQIEEKKALIKKAKEDLDKALAEAKDIRKEFIKTEKKLDAEHKTAMKPYRPSLWKSIKDGIRYTAKGVIQFINDVRAERKAGRDAKKEAKKEARNRLSNERYTEIFDRYAKFRGEQHVPEENLAPMPDREPGADGKNERLGNSEHEEPGKNAIEEK